MNSAQQENACRICVVRCCDLLAPRSDARVANAANGLRHCMYSVEAVTAAARCPHVLLCATQLNLLPMLCAAARCSPHAAVCAPGFGGPGCSQLCGGVGISASYGPPGRAVNAPCVLCSSNGETRGFSYDWALGNDYIAPRTVSRDGAALSIECLSEYSQLSDGSFYLPLSSDAGVAVTDGVLNFTACVELCSEAECQLVTYDYRLRKCSVRVSQAPVYEG